MNKPISIARKEFTEGLINLINTSGLQAFIMRQVLAQADGALAQLEQEQFDKDMAEWNAQQKEDEGDDAVEA